MIYSFDTEIAEKYGDRAAYFIGYLQYNIVSNRANKRNFHEGRTWSYNSMAALTKIYTWLSKRQIRTIIDNLVENNVIVKCNARVGLKVSGINPKTNAYAFVNEEEWLGAEKTNIPNKKQSVEKGKIRNQKLLTYYEMLNGTEKMSQEERIKHQQRYETIKIEDKIYWKLKEAA